MVSLAAAANKQRIKWRCLFEIRMRFYLDATLCHTGSLADTKGQILGNKGEGPPIGQTRLLVSLGRLLIGFQREFSSEQRRRPARSRRQQSRVRVLPGRSFSDSWLQRIAAAKFSTNRPNHNIQSANFDKATLGPPR